MKMKKILSVLALSLLLAGCGSYNAKSATKDLEKKINNIKGYNLTGQLVII